MTREEYHAHKAQQERRRQIERRGYEAAKGPLDLPLLLLTLLLTGMGLLMLFSASFPSAYYESGDPAYYLKRQAFFAALGLAAMFVVSKINYQRWRGASKILLGFAIFLLILVIIPHNPLAQTRNNATRWLGTQTISFQPSEIAKLAVVVFFADSISKKRDKMQTLRFGVIPYTAVLGVISVLMLLEPHLSGTLLILSIGAVLMFVGGTGLHWFGLAGGLGAAAIAAAVIALPELVPYATDRLASWRDPFADPLGEGHQTIQSLYAIASGGLAGLGLGNSRQKYLYVPEPQNDFIFSILCEELGFIGAALVVALFLLLLLRGMSIAVRARDKFGALLVVGFVVQVTLQAILNMAVVTNTIPNTGISLPFFSSGGTSLLMLLGEMGIVLSVSRQTDMV